MVLVVSEPMMKIMMIVNLMASSKVQHTLVLQVIMPLSINTQSGIPVNYWLTKLPLNPNFNLSKLVFLILYTVFNTKTTNLSHSFYFQDLNDLSHMRIVYTV